MQSRTTRILFVLAVVAVAAFAVFELPQRRARDRAERDASRLFDFDATAVDGVRVRRGGPRLQRIGLSATVRPLEVAARMLVGSDSPLPDIVDAERPRALDLAIEVPRDELGAACTNEQWGEIYDRIAELSRGHRSTLVFVNTRRLVERVAHNLAARLGDAAVGAHHGSLSRERRFKTEQRLKAGDAVILRTGGGGACLGIGSRYRFASAKPSSALTSPTRISVQLLGA